MEPEKTAVAPRAIRVVSLVNQLHHYFIHRSAWILKSKQQPSKNVDNKKEYIMWFTPLT